MQTLCVVVPSSQKAVGTAVGLPPPLCSKRMYGSLTDLTEVAISLGFVGRDLEVNETWVNRTIKPELGSFVCAGHSVVGCCDP